MNLSKTELQILRAIKTTMTPDELIIWERHEKELERKENREENFWKEVEKHLPLKASVGVLNNDEWTELDKDFSNPRIESFDQMKFK